MLKRLVIIFICLQCFTAIYAQDTIVQLNGTEIRVRVKEIDDVNVKYTRFDNQNGPVYLVKKSQVAMIKYENGTRDVFSQNEVKVENNEVKIDKKKDQKTNSGEKITMKRGKYCYEGRYLTNKQLKDIIVPNATPEIIQGLNNGIRNRTISDVIGYVGFFTELSGLMIYSASNHKNTAGVALAITGFGIMTIGLPFNFIGKSQIKKSVLKYNNTIASSYKPSFNFGLNPQGFVITYRF
jgi:hypothetical protein